MPAWLRTAVALFGLTGIAIAQPLFSLIGENPTFFVAHGAGRDEVIAFAFLIMLVPTVVLTSVVLAIRSLSKVAGEVAMAVVVGLLGTLALFSVIRAVDDASPIVFALGLALGAALIGSAYHWFAAARSFVTLLAPAAVLFAVLFLFASPVSALVVDDDPTAISGTRATDVPVVVLLFDELPLGALLDGRGDIDAERFPNFARLAASSTWYRNATTVSPWTHLAVPAILTGTLPDPTKPPVAGQYPRSLFTMFGGSHRLEVTEQVTSLCPEGLCADGSNRSRPVTLAKDTGLVMLHQMLPTSLADRWLPSVSGQWADFGGGDEDGSLTNDPALDMEAWQAENNGKQHESDFGGFLASIAGDGKRTLWYHHEMVPHMPYRFLPDGTSYDGLISGSLSADWVDWVADPAGTINASQRFMLQLRYADREVGEFLDRLQEQNLFRDALVAVVADHGISFKAGGQRRGVTQLTPSGDRVTLTAARMAGGAADEVMPVPLFVKYPDQTTGAVDARAAQTIDLLPTLADALELELPSDWVFDGRSLLDDPPAETPRNWVNGTTPPETYGYQPDANRMAQYLRELMGSGGSRHDLYAVGPAGGLVGKKVDGRVGSAAESEIRPVNPVQFDDIDPAATVQPVLFTAQALDIAPGSWVAIALNGTVAGLGPVFIGREGTSVLEVMVDPSLMRPGRNELQGFLVGDDDATLHPITD